ncbi:Ubiquitin carboxyl-terminal hydrolase, partial [Operophtera brumata]
TINNACATQAIISLLLNCDHPDLELGVELTKLKEFSRSLDAQMAGYAISNSQVIRAAHNSMGSQYTEGEIHFNLMALVSNRKMVLTRQMQELVSSTALHGMQCFEVESELTRLRMDLDYEDVKMLIYAREMARRRHNYIPFIVELLQVLAESKQLSSLVSAARQRIKKRGNKRIKT